MNKSESETIKSANHLVFVRMYGQVMELLQWRGEVYYSPVAQAIEGTGNRSGRFLCYSHSVPLALRANGAEVL